MILRLSWNFLVCKRCAVSMCFSMLLLTFLLGAKHPVDTTSKGDHSCVDLTSINLRFINRYI